MWLCSFLIKVYNSFSPGHFLPSFSISDKPFVDVPKIIVKKTTHSKVMIFYSALRRYQSLRYHNNKRRKGGSGRSRKTDAGGKRFTATAQKY